MATSNSGVADQRRVYPVTLYWGDLQENRKVPVLLDHKVQVMEAFTQFGIYKAKPISQTAQTSSEKQWGI